MSLVKIKHKAQITLPAQIRKVLGIEEGDYLEVKVERNRVILIPQTLIEKIPSVTLSGKGKQMLKEGLEDVKAGRAKEFKDVDKLIEDLDK